MPLGPDMDRLCNRSRCPGMDHHKNQNNMSHILCHKCYVRIGTFPLQGHMVVWSDCCSYTCYMVDRDYLFLS